MGVSVTFSRCFALGLHSPIGNVSGNTLQRALQAAGPYRIRRSTRPRIAEGTRHKGRVPFECAGEASGKSGGLQTSRPLRTNNSCSNSNPRATSSSEAAVFPPLQTYLPTMDRAKVRILRFKKLPPFRHYPGLQNHVCGIHQGWPRQLA
jgi:hypothetical protein